MASDTMVFGGMFYILGTIVYAFRIPERFFTGRFDIFGQSHQIFHSCVVAGAYFHYVAIHKMFEFWMSENPVCEVSIEEMRNIYF